jgi:hypothetical protein
MHVGQQRVRFIFQLVAEIDRYNEHAVTKLTNDVLRIRERIRTILSKLSVDDEIHQSKYAILQTSKAARVTLANIHIHTHDLQMSSPTMFTSCTKNFSKNLKLTTK